VDEIPDLDLDKLPSKEEIAALILENAKNFLSDKSSNQTGLVSTIMERHGFTEEEALEN